MRIFEKQLNSSTIIQAIEYSPRTFRIPYFGLKCVPFEQLDESWVEVFVEVKEPVFTSKQSIDMGNNWIDVNQFLPMDTDNVIALLNTGEEKEMWYSKVYQSWIVKKVGKQILVTHWKKKTN